MDGRVSGVGVMLSKRAFVEYIEHARVTQRNGRVIYMVCDAPDKDVGFNVPDKNTAFLLLGKGTSITDSAVRLLAESNVIVGFCGSGGSPLFGALDISFLLPNDEYRPTQYMQAWAKMWFDESARLEAAKKLLSRRSKWAFEQWQALGLGELMTDAILDRFERDVASATDTTTLLTAEGRRAKLLYAALAKKYSIGDFTRSPGEASDSECSAKVNSMLDHGNYLAYGYAAVALYALGISYCFPLLHGKTRRGGLVFDIADLFKDWLVMPAAFAHGSKNEPDKNLRADIIDTAFRKALLDSVFEEVKSIIDVN